MTSVDVRGGKTQEKKCVWREWSSGHKAAIPSPTSPVGSESRNGSRYRRSGQDVGRLLNRGWGLTSWRPMSKRRKGFG
jgi:hypothetical protein